MKVTDPPPPPAGQLFPSRFYNPGFLGASRSRSRDVTEISRKASCENARFLKILFFDVQRKVEQGWEAVSTSKSTSKITSKSLPPRGRINEAWGPIPPLDWRAREVTKQLGSDGLGVWEVLGSDKPEPIRSFSGFASSWVLRVRARLRLDTARAPTHRRCAWGCCASFRKDRYVFGAPARPHAARVSI